ncbi:isochorismatase family protein [Pseudothauera rhizosphaerae]|uniref:isochorismatase n=1 Tax=Pseudothauera rhizosphaerae TaxID=2565932 RepID=A0A4S4ABT6_9RHOO|nr:isochorismatase family protein [Pseudothauera rhizosphaerae]THF55623.1 isochorismatase family protein [Pseudothauera rhizosphaerae]
MAIPKIASYPMPAQGWNNRVLWQPEARRAALLVHDMQDYFLDFYDRERAPVPELLANVRRLLDLARELGMPVIYTAQSPAQTPAERGLLQDMWGPGLTARPQRKDIAAELAPQPQDVVLDKWRYSAFQRSPLLELLRGQGRDQLIVCGIYAHIGCMATACEAFMSDIQPFFAADALADFSAQEHEMALRYVSQRCGVTLPTQALVDGLRPRLPASPGELRQIVADSLKIAAADPGEDESLLDWGLDSIRIMALLETWRRAGLDVDFMALAGQPTLAAWWALLNRREAEVCA